MAEIRNNFIKSKMNKDLDARLVPSGEYRDAQNVSISKSEGDDVGALENVLGNISLTDFGYTTTPCNIDIIGKYMDVVNDRIIVFMTNYVDTSTDKLSNFSPANVTNSIGVYDLTNSDAIVVVTGQFLNFSKTHPIYGVNLIENLLFWTDNRNQPRKINITTAIGDPTYYTTEDHISVAKYYPYETIDLWKNEVVNFTLVAAGSGYTNGTFYNTPTSGGSGSGLTVNITVVGNAVTALTIHSLGIGYINGETITIVGAGGSNATFTITVEIVSTMQDVVSEDLPAGVSGVSNPLYNSDWEGDPNYLKDKFVRFSYRFKFDDNEYSLIAPFTQECFVPQQDGYFLDELHDSTVDDEKTTYQSTEVGFMQNKINNITMVLNSPATGGGGGWDQVDTELKISEIEILYKQSDQNVIKIVETIPATIFNLETTPFLEYNYQSNKPWKTLPTKDLLRVYDQVPIRALAQEVAGNRVIYGNYIDKGTPPLSLDYSISTSIKEDETVTYDGERHVSRKEYQNHTLKQNRTYQVGVILADRYGRQSTVILSSYDTDPSNIPGRLTSLGGGSTVFHPFKSSGFSSWPATGSYDPLKGLVSNSTTWPGDSLKTTFDNTISSTKSSLTGEPGLYNATTNPLGWYSFKMVVKQPEQDYYNVYFPGILNGYIDGQSKNPLSASPSEPICHFVLHSDNINKIPRDLSLVGPNQDVFRTGRPAAKDDPSYYQFVDSSGNAFAADPFTEEGETLLKERDRLRDLDSGSQITNASISLSPRVQNHTGALGNNPIFGAVAEFISPIPSTAAGTGYSTGTYFTFTSGTGTGLRVNILAAGGVITGAKVVTGYGGIDYQVGDEVAVLDGDNLGILTVGALSGAFTKQSYPGTAKDTVTTIGTGTELGLWDPSAKPPYDTAPVFFGYENNPYVAKVRVSDSSIGVIGPSPTAGKLHFQFPSGLEQSGNFYIAGTKNLSTKPVGPTPFADLATKQQGALVNINAINDGGGAPRTSVPGSEGILVNDGFEVANEDGEGMIGWDAPDNIYPYSTNLRFLGGDNNGVVKIITNKTKFPGSMTPILTIYEAEPLESKLDIYWETSTNGLISLLNTQIESGDLFTPMSFSDFSGAEIIYSQNESFATGTDVTGIDIFVTNSAGTALNTGDNQLVNNFVLASVIDALGNERKTEFTLTSNTGEAFFRISTNGYFMYGSDATTRENYIFYITYEVPSASWVTDGQTITNTLPLGFNNTVTQTYDLTLCQLANTAPSFTVCPVGTLTPASGGLIHTLTAINGSNTAGTLEAQQLTFDITAGNGSGIFYLQTTFTQGEIALYNIAAPAGSHTLTVTVTDGGGATADCVSLITLI